MTAAAAFGGAEAWAAPPQTDDHQPFVAAAAKATAPRPYKEWLTELTAVRDNEIRVVER